MRILFFDCPTGIAGDMLLAALLDLGVPKEVIEKPLFSLGLGKSFSLSSEEGSSFGIRGLRVNLIGLDQKYSSTSLQQIISTVEASDWDNSLKEEVLNVFHSLADAEACVHGKSVEEIHFHEVGSLDALIEIVCVCAAIKYLEPMRIFCTNPPAGSGSVKTSHGILPVPVPVVFELSKKFQINLAGGPDYPKGELTTPTGLALMAVLADEFRQPDSLNIQTIGVGLGQRNLDRPNFLRVCLLDDVSHRVENIYWEDLLIQEAWIDDSTPEDTSVLKDELRKAGALEVISHSIQMKKGRQAICIKAIVKSEQANELRKAWFSKGTTIGLRENIGGRWVLPRRQAVCATPLGEVKIKQVKRPNGNITTKIEHDELVRLSTESGKSLEDVRQKISSHIHNFLYKEEWSL